VTGARQHLVVMGVAGCGKTTVAERLAAELGWAFAEGDAYHPPANVAKMSAGLPLDDDDRGPWLEALAGWIAAREAKGRSSIVACSALRRAYRDILRGGAPLVRFVHLHGDFDLLAARIGAREGHFFPPELLASQFEALEALGATRTAWWSTWPSRRRARSPRRGAASGSPERQATRRRITSASGVAPRRCSPTPGS
jgi:carbohydrate kinase (thermoresistant glucokinase family)